MIPIENFYSFKQSFENLNSKRWKEIFNKYIIGRSEKGFHALRLSIENIISIQNNLKDLKHKHEYELSNPLIDKGYTSIGIENISYKSRVSMLEDELENSISSLYKLKTSFDQIPQIGGKINFILDYLLHDIRWVCIEIQTNNIETRFTKELCIYYIKEAEKMFHKRFI